jgi:hypothetical protein
MKPDAVDVFISDEIVAFLAILAYVCVHMWSPCDATYHAPALRMTYSCGFSFVHSEGTLFEKQIPDDAHRKGDKPCHGLVGTT